jgi:hypothetical protein
VGARVVGTTWQPFQRNRASLRRSFGRRSRTIRAAAPDATETISHQIPNVKLNGKSRMVFAAWMGQCGFYVTSLRRRP